MATATAETGGFKREGKTEGISLSPLSAPRRTDEGKKKEREPSRSSSLFSFSLSTSLSLAASVAISRHMKSKSSTRSTPRGRQKEKEKAARAEKTTRDSTACEGKNASEQSERLDAMAERARVALFSLSLSLSTHASTHAFLHSTHQFCRVLPRVVVGHGGHGEREERSFENRRLLFFEARREAKKKNTSVFFSNSGGSRPRFFPQKRVPCWHSYSPRSGAKSVFVRFMVEKGETREAHSETGTGIRAKRASESERANGAPKRDRRVLCPPKAPLFRLSFFFPRQSNALSKDHRVERSLSLSLSIDNGRASTRR